MENLDKLQKDHLTGVYTRDQLDSLIDERITDAKENNKKFSLLLIDLDRFKRVNDKYGHKCGDEVLKYVSSNLRLSLGNEGLIFRYGGDEFVVLFSTSDPRQAFLLARRFNLVMRRRAFLFKGRLFKMGASCGLAVYPDNAANREDLLEAADRALYFSKRYVHNTTTRANKVGIRKFLMFLIVYLEVFLLVSLIFFINSFDFKGFVQRSAKSLLMSNLVPSGLKDNATIVLKNGTKIEGTIVTEEKDRIVVFSSFEAGKAGKGDGLKINIDKSQIRNILISP